MLLHKQGNLIDLAEAGEFDVIIHGCNCQNTMGSGIAKEIRTRYPQAYHADYEASTTGMNRPGEYSGVRLGNRFWIINAYTQDHYLPRGVDHFEYEGFQRILDHLHRDFPKCRFGLPYIGMGLAGGDPSRIIPMIKNFTSLVTLGGGTVTLVKFI